MQYRAPTKVQIIKDVLLILISLVVAPLMAWLLLTAVQTQKDVLEMRKDLAYHVMSREKSMDKNSALHHTKKITPCYGCHEK